MTIWKLAHMLNFDELFDFIHLDRKIGVTPETLSCFVGKLWLDRQVLKTKPMPLDATKKFWVENGANEAPKSGKNGRNF